MLGSTTVCMDGAQVLSEPDGEEPGLLEHGGKRFAFHRVSLAGPEDDAAAWLRSKVNRLAQLSCIGLPKIHHVAISNDVGWIVFEDVRGATLRDYVRGGVLTDEDVVAVAHDIGTALSAIHDLGEHHGSLSPTSIVAADGGGWCLRAFGACLAAADRQYGPRTPLPAPEARRRADLEALGRALWAGLMQEAGEVDFDVARLRVRSRPLAGVILRLLGEQSEGRFASSRELLSDISRRFSYADADASSRLARVRRSELQSLRERLRHGDGLRTVILRGPPGAGKTHLVNAFAEKVPRGELLIASCRSWDVSPFATVRQLLEGLVVSEGEIDERRLNDLLTLAGPLARLLRPLSPVLQRAAPYGAVPGCEGADDVYSQGLAEVLVRALRRQPMTLVIEDVQWLDEGSRKVLKRVFDLLETTTYVVVSARSGLDDEHHAQRFLGALQGSVVWDHTLGRLSTGEASQLVSDYLGALPIDPERARALALLGDGTPLSVLEVVRSVLDEGLLVPHWSTWRLDVAKVAQLSLPNTTADLIAQRLRRLPTETVSVLRLAAILGREFDRRDLTSRHDGTSVDAELARAQRHYLVEGGRGTMFRFVHQCVIDALVGECDETTTRKLHARAAQLLTPRDGSLDELETQRLLRLAGHLGAAGPECDEEAVFRASLLAGVRASEAHDNAAALRFLRQAHDLAHTESRLATGVGRLMAEVQLRRGELRESLQGFQAALDVETDPVERAQVLGHIASIHEVHLDSGASFAALSRAFGELGERVPSFTVGTAAALPLFLMNPPDQQPPVAMCGDSRRTEVLCGLIFQNNRLCLVASNVGSFIDGALRCVKVSRSLGPSQALSKAYTIAGFLLAVLRRPKAALTLIQRALEIARQINDPPATAHVLSQHAGVAVWLGDVDGAMSLGGEVLSEHHSWLIPSELAVLSMNQEILDTVRGHSRRSWAWLARAIPRAIQYEGSPVITDLFALRCTAAAVRLGIEEQQRDLLRRIEHACLKVPKDSGYYSWLYGARVRAYTETGDLGDGFERLVGEFETMKLDPRKVHLVTTEYYVAVAHARAHACLRASAPTLDQVGALEKAARDVRLAARIPLLRAHAAAVDGFVAVAKGRYRKAEIAFRRAHEVGTEESAPWVLFAVARGRAHARFRRGDQDSATREARLAEALALEHGSVHWLRWIREEFSFYREVDATPIATTTEYEQEASDHSRERILLDSFIRINRALSKERGPQDQARAVLDELTQVLRARRGYIYLRHAAEGRNAVLSSARDLGRIAAREAGGSDLPETDVVPEDKLDAVLRDRQVVICNPECSDGARRPMVLAPLIIQDSIVGVVTLRGGASRAPFTRDDSDVLQALCGQVPVTLELARALRDRERLSEDLRQSQKMEAIGRLAGGIAHDFNNMLAAICVAVESVMVESDADSPHRPDLETIQRAAERATRLTRQLLTFSRRQVFDARPLDLNQTVRDIAPMLNRLLGERINVDVDLVASKCPVKADVGQMEQVLVNLAVNARDAMPGGGNLRITTRSVRLEANQKPGLAADDYVLLRVTDTGEGMDEEVRRRVFEPFFTTKTAESGTGLGMAMVYGIVRQSGGYIDLESTVGVGTEFRIYLPRTNEAIETVPPKSLVRRGPKGGRILLVDDEPLVRHALGRTLRRMGYDVTIATGGREAIRILSQNPSVDVIITDVIMPEMNGVEMVEKLGALGVRAKVLYVSGYADGVLPARAGLGDRVEFMQKPLMNDALAAKVRDLLGGEQQSHPGDVG